MARENRNGRCPPHRLRLSMIRGRPSQRSYPMAKHPTQDKLDRWSDRLTELLQQESDPQAAMQSASQRLIEAGLSLHTPKADESPFQFAQTVIADNLQMWDELAPHPLPNLQAIGSAEDLITRLLPSP